MLHISQIAIKYDPWQLRVLKHKGSITLRCGRQTGKSTIIALKAFNLAHEYPGTTTLVIGPGIRQSALLYEKIRALFEEEDGLKTNKINRNDYRNQTEFRHAQKEVSIFVDEPTQTRIRLKNGSQVICVPCGQTGAKIRGYTVDFLIADEAQEIPDPVWVAVEPMLATSHKVRGTGWIILLGTPKGKRGRYYESFSEKEFMHIHVSAEKVKRYDKRFLKRKKKTKSLMEYSQEYLAEFVEAHDQFFLTDLLKKRTTFKLWNFENNYDKNKKYYLGIDPARLGGDQTAFVISELVGKQMRIVWCDVDDKARTSETAGRARALDSVWNFSRIFIDGLGVGGGVVDILLDSPLKNKIRELNNSSRSVSDDKERRIFKEDLYIHAQVMMEQGQLDLIDNKKLFNSLTSVSFEYSAAQNLIIKGKGSHLAEAFVRACWGMKDKGLDLFCM